MNGFLSIVVVIALNDSVNETSSLDHNQFAMMEEVKKKKKKGKKIGGSKGKKSKKGFFSKIFGSK
jgi:hypothetical protein|tara:strand:+ start:971 stop:1165 length:195 start_codon:yes stop_codon:yes gene_type:complete